MGNHHSEDERLRLHAAAPRSDGHLGGKGHSAQQEQRVQGHHERQRGFRLHTTGVKRGQRLHRQVLGTMRIGSFAANSIVAEDFEARSDDFPNQNWLAARMDTFTNGTDGWQILPVALSAGSADNEDLGTSKCGGLGEILGGPCKTSYHTIEKTYADLPNHAEIQITARVHFLDNWDDDTMWMKAGSAGTVSVSAPVWAEEYTWCPQFFTFMCNGGVSACGKAHYPDKLSRLVTVSMEHSAPDLTLQFGTNIKPGTPPCEVSYGVSHVTVEVR